jgi:hypothetical protein
MTINLDAPLLTSNEFADEATGVLRTPALAGRIPVRGLLRHTNGTLRFGPLKPQAAWRRAPADLLHRFVNCANPGELVKFAAQFGALNLLRHRVSSGWLVEPCPEIEREKHMEKLEWWVWYQRQFVSVLRLSAFIRRGEDVDIEPADVVSDGPYSWAAITTDTPVDFVPDEDPTDWMLWKKGARSHRFRAAEYLVATRVTAFNEKVRYARARSCGETASHANALLRRCEARNNQLIWRADITGNVCGNGRSDSGVCRLSLSVYASPAAEEILQGLRAQGRGA